MDYSARNIVELACEDIAPSGLNPRQEFDSQALSDLAENIRVNGLLQPIVVRDGRSMGMMPYQIVAGERRWRAVKSLGRQTVPAIVRQCGDAELVSLALSENLARRDITALEEAAGYRTLVGLGQTQSQIATSVGVTQGAVSRRLALLELPAEVLQAVRDGHITHAQATSGRKHWVHPASSHYAYRLIELVASGEVPTRVLESASTFQLASRCAVPGSAHLGPPGYTKCAECTADSISAGEHSGRLCLNPACRAEQAETARQAKAAQPPAADETSDYKLAPIERTCHVCGRRIGPGTPYRDMPDGTAHLMCAGRKPAAYEEPSEHTQEAEQENCATILDYLVRVGGLIHRDAVARDNHLNLGQVSCALTLLEAGGQVKSHPGGVFSALPACAAQAGVSAEGETSITDTNPELSACDAQAVPAHVPVADCVESGAETIHALAPEPRRLGSPGPALTPDELAADFVRMHEDLTAGDNILHRRIADLTHQVAELESQLAARDSKISGLEKQIEHMRQARDRRERDADPPPAEPADDRIARVRAILQESRGRAHIGWIAQELSGNRDRKGGSEVDRASAGEILAVMQTAGEAYPDAHGLWYLVGSQADQDYKRDAASIFTTTRFNPSPAETAADVAAARCVDGDYLKITDGYRSFTSDPAVRSALEHMAAEPCAVCGKRTGSGRQYWLNEAGEHIHATCQARPEK